HHPTFGTSVSADVAVTRLMSAAESDDEHADMSISSTSKGRLLVVDDEPPLLRTVERILRNRGYAVECASNGEEAKSRLASGVFEAVLCDIAMPGMGGIELLESVRKRDLDIPVVLMTGEPAIDTAI